MILIFLGVLLGVFGVAFAILWLGRALQRRSTRRLPFAVGFCVLLSLGTVLLIGPWNAGAVRVSAAIVCLVVATVCLAVLIDTGPKPSAATSWAAAHGLTVTEHNSDFVVAYVFQGHRLRLVCGIGGFIVAVALSAGTGIDLKASGWVWLLSGYLIGVVWSESWLTRLPAGTQRVASLTPRKVSDYLVGRMLIAQVVVVLGALAMVGFAVAQGTDPQLVGGFSSSFGATSGRSLQHTAIVMGLAAALLSLGVGLLQQHIVGKAQPMADPDLLASDDAVRASAVHLLSGTIIAIVLLLISTQLQMLAAIGAFADGVAGLGALICLVGALLAWRFYGHRAWAVKRSESLHSSPSTWEEPGRATMTPRCNVGVSPFEAERTGRVVVMSEQPIMRRTPVRYALAVVIALAAVGVLLRSWGPINPAIRTGITVEHGSFSGGGQALMDAGWGVDGTARATVHLTNESRSSVSVARLRPVRVANSSDLPLPSVKVGTHQDQVPPHQSVDIDVTLVASKACGTWVTHLPSDGRVIGAGSFSVVADLHTASGLTKTVGRNTQLQNICPKGAFLPSPGVQPPDSAVAKHAVTVAFWTVYDSRNSLAERANLIDDVAGIPVNRLPGGFRSQVHGIVFTSPTTATVMYDISSGSNPVVPDQLGHARLVDGTWKVTKSSVCDDLALAGLHCT